MSVTVRPYVTGGWEVDIRVVLPDGTVIRERRKAQQSSESSARRWAEARERHLLLHGKPKPVRKEERKTPTLREFAPKFLNGYATANRLKPSGVSSKEVAIRVHLFPQFGDRRLDDITTEDVQQLKSAMVARSPKTVNNVLTVLSVMLRTAVEWNAVERVPCTIKLLKAPKTTAAFYDFEAYERLVEAARRDTLAYLIVLLGGEAGLRCGEIMALEWSNVDLKKRQLCVAQSEWKGHLTAPKGGRIRYVPLTRRLANALNGARHLRSPRVLCDRDGKSVTQKVVQVAVRRAARRANVKPGVHIPQAHVLLAPGDAWRAGESDSGARRTSGPLDHAAVHAPEPGRDRCGHQAA